MTRLDDLRDLYWLKKLAEGGQRFDVSSLEREFLTFSKYASKKRLTVHIPKLHPLEGVTAEKVCTALNVVDTIPEIDISGACAAHSLDDVVIFVSLQQIKADHVVSSRSYLNPLLEKIYADGAALIRDFALHEVLVGKVERKRGAVNVTEIPLFPEKFVPGQYVLRVTLDTPQGTVARLKSVYASLGEFSQDPKRIIDAPKIHSVVNDAVELRKVLGSLSRYDATTPQSFEVETNSCVIRNSKTTCFYLYSSQEKKNIVVYFGESPFKAGKQPKELMVLHGKEHQYVLAKLVELGFFEPSAAVVHERVQVLEQMYGAAVRSIGRVVSYDDFNAFREELAKTETLFRTAVNKDSLRRFVVNSSPELLEFMVYPSTNDPVVHELLPRLSWNRFVRRYHNADKFMYQFEHNDADGRKQLLDETVANIVMSNQQNNDVNVWLYQKHKDFCEKQGITFDLV